MGTALTEVYRGPTHLRAHARKIKDCEIHLGLRRGESFDSILSSQLARAVNNGESQVTLVDIGSGSGGVFDDFLIQLDTHRLGLTSSQPTTRNSVRILSENPKLRLRMVGVTDATRDMPFLKAEKSVSINGQVTSENVGFSLTKEQTYADFLTSQNIDTVNLTLATWSLAYFHPFLFRDTVKTAVDSLVPGGEFVAGMYSEVSGPGLSRYTKPKVSSRESPRIVSMFMNATDPILGTPTTEQAQSMIGVYRVLLNRYKHILERQDRVLGFDLFDHLTPKQIQLWLHSDAKELWSILNSYRIELLHDEKTTMLRELGEVYKDVADFSVESTTFRIKKLLLTHAGEPR